VNILVITPFLPCKGKHGGAAQMFNLWSEFQKQDNVDLHILAHQTDMELGEEAYTAAVFDSIDIIKVATPSEWMLKGYIDENAGSKPFFSGEFQKKLGELLLMREWDVVILEMQFMMHCAELISQKSSAKIGLIVHESLDIRYKQDPEMLHDFINYRQHFFDQLDFLICFSEEDKASIKWFTKPIYTLSLCVDVEELYQQERNQSDLMFLGSYGHQPNIDSVNLLLEEVLPLVKEPFTLRVCGSQLTNELKDKWQAYPNVKVVGYVEDAKLEMAKCTVFVAPIVSGKGVRTKLVEALSQNTPVVTTSLGMEGIEAKIGTDCFVANSPVELASAIDQLLLGALVVGKNARTAVANHQAEIVASKLTYIIERVV